MDKITFNSTLECDKDGTWWYAHVPSDVRKSLRGFEKRGSVRVKATIGLSTWEGSLLPWADGSAQISINKEVRSKEGLLKISVRPARLS